MSEMCFTAYEIPASQLIYKSLYEFRVPETTELGHAVGAIRALDGDIGENAEMDYRIIGSDGPGVFDVATNRSTQEGVIVLRKGEFNNVYADFQSSISLASDGTDTSEGSVL
ncbi:hypothetical protein F2P81_026070 [Scophthalmus maximus]|uniref:Cadherin domain-containing protein n=1 Tax=Scophthalmus maximus TaxID=52904 RepID=A0A6A4RNH6_SCOMX|nr:hypothetical protein F2P81_026070 [Scophthalmus maximus]